MISNAIWKMFSKRDTIRGLSRLTIYAHGILFNREFLWTMFDKVGIARRYQF